jgi:hypothetical protein
LERRLADFGHFPSEIASLGSSKKEWHDAPCDIRRLQAFVRRFVIGRDLWIGFGWFGVGLADIRVVVEF